MEQRTFVGNGDCIFMNNQTIRVVENGQEKTSTTSGVNKVKLDRVLDSRKLESIINEKEKNK